MKQHIKTHRLERMTEREKAEYLPKSARMAATADAMANWKEWLFQTSPQYILIYI